MRSRGLSVSFDLDAVFDVEFDIHHGVVSTRLRYWNESDAPDRITIHDTIGPVGRLHHQSIYAGIHEYRSGIAFQVI